MQPVDSLTAVDFMDEGAKIQLKLTIDRQACCSCNDHLSRIEGTAIFDFAGTDCEVYGNVNAPKAVTTSAIIYCLRCLVKRDIPLNQGCLNPIQINIPDGTILSPSETAAVVGGAIFSNLAHVSQATC